MVVTIRNKTIIGGAPLVIGHVHRGVKNVQSFGMQSAKIIGNLKIFWLYFAVIHSSVSFILPQAPQRGKRDAGEFILSEL